MRQTRTAALSRHAAPTFALVAGLELIQLRRLSWLARAMFLELVAMCDHATGQGRTSWAVLVALLDFDQAPQANTTATATPKRLRGAMAELEQLGLVWLDRIKNEKAQALFFRVASRSGVTAPDDMRGRVQGRVKKAAAPREKPVHAADAGQGAGQGVQEPNSYPPTPLQSTGTKPPAAVGELLQRLRPARGRARAPEGA